MPELSHHERNRALQAGVAVVLALTAGGVLICGREDEVPAHLDVSPAPTEVETTREGVKQRLSRLPDEATLSGDDDSVLESEPSVKIDPDVFDDGLWDLSSVSSCVRASGDALVSYPMGPNEMRVVSTLEGPHVPVHVQDARNAVLLRFGRIVVRYDWGEGASQDDVESRLTEACRDALWAVHRTDWPKETLCGNGMVESECEDYVGELQYEGSTERRPVEMMDNLVDLLEGTNLFESIDRYKPNAMTIEPSFSRGMGYLSVMVELRDVEGEPSLIYEVTSTTMGGFPSFRTPEEVVEYVLENADRP